MVDRRRPRRTTRDSIASPTLIADGNQDRLDPVVNDHVLAGQIPGSSLVLYPGAGHAFFIQDEATFVPVVVAFLR